MSYAGDITPEEAWKLLSDNPDAVLVDCRTEAEWRFVGVPDLSSLQREVVFVEWSSSDGRPNDSFVEQLKAAGVTAELTRRPGAGHGWVGIEKDLKLFADWFDRHLKKPATQRSE